jgi:hypothetical protein
MNQPISAAPKPAYYALAQYLNDLRSKAGGMSVSSLKNSLEERGQRVSLQAIYCWMNGKKRPSTANLEVMCDIFDLSTEGCLKLYKLHSRRS